MNNFVNVQIQRDYAVYRNGLLWTRTLTLGKAQKYVKHLRANGFMAEIKIEKGDN